MAPRICESTGCGMKIRWWERITGCRRANEHGILKKACIDAYIAAALAKKAVERAKVPTQVIKDDAHKPKEGDSRSIKAAKETTARQKDVEAAERAKEPAQARGNAADEQHGSQAASITDAQTNVTHRAQNGDPDECVHESDWLEAALPMNGATLVAGVEPSWGKEHPLGSSMPNVVTRSSFNEEDDLPRVRFPSSLETEHADRTDTAPEADPDREWPHQEVLAVHMPRQKKQSRRRTSHCNHPQWDKILGAGSCEKCRSLGRRGHFMPNFLYKCRRCPVSYCMWCAQRHGRIYG